MQRDEHKSIGPRTPVGCPAAGTPLSQNRPIDMTEAAGCRKLYSFLYSTSTRTSVALGGTVLAASLEDARHAAGHAIIAKYTNGVLKVIEVARNSRFPVKDQSGWIAPSLSGGLGGTHR